MGDIQEIGQHQIIVYYGVEGNIIVTMCSERLETDHAICADFRPSVKSEHPQSIVQMSVIRSNTISARLSQVTQL